MAKENPKDGADRRLRQNIAWKVNEITAASFFMYFVDVSTDEELGRIDCTWGW